MSGYIDIHSHLLPGVDDGVKSAAEALECFSFAKKAGFSDLVMTRHLMSGVYDASRENAAERIGQLELLLGEAGIDIRLHNGAEYYLDETFLPKLDSGVETLANGRYLLVEMPLMQIPIFLPEVAFKIRLKGYIPILAHIERYREIAEKPAKALEIREMGFLLQVNLGSLAGMYGPSVARAARFVLDKELAFCAAGDAHGAAWLAPIYTAGVKELKMTWGEKVVSMLLRDNPQTVLRDGQ